MLIIIIIMAHAVPNSTEGANEPVNLLVTAIC